MSIRHELNGTVYYVYNDKPKLPVIIMIHGYRGTHHGLELIAKRLDGYRVVIPDLPGFGESKPLKNEHSLKNYVKWLGEFIDSLNLSTPPILLGHSFGSIITSSYASENPNKITKLILVNPIGAPALKGPKAIMTRLALFYYWLGRVLPERMAMRWLSSKPTVMIMSTTMAETSDKDLRKFIHNQHLTHFSSFANSKVAAEAFKTSVRHNVRDVAQIVTVPTLIIAGEDDNITPILEQRELTKLFPNAKLEIIKGVGHLTHYETPDSVADAIKQFAP
ncbi:MAG TPA: alpha/beta hydrolase [Candidatus Angelobacter sp.]|nr:alpha/beta hydrolase [Candidatus Angelobacter sp.]